MRPYFEKMNPIGKALTDKERNAGKTNAGEITGVDEEVAQALEARRQTGLPVAKLHKRGEKTAWERIDSLVDPGTFLPLKAAFDARKTEGETKALIVVALGNIVEKEQPPVLKRIFRYYNFLLTWEDLKRIFRLM